MTIVQTGFCLQSHTVLLHQSGVLKKKKKGGDEPEPVDKRNGARAHGVQSARPEDPGDLVPGCSALSAPVA